ncbi:MAG: TIGR03619 family F420-dependent LLM class oxidoreductase [Myxococcota bacterium]|nr:TIGR03619 family F420-dependent LLM class oxidoreductase [Myxococcota bacterium]
MKFGIALGALNPSIFDQAVLEAERLGFESCWLPEHLVLTEDMSGSPHPGEDLPPVPPTTPVFDAFGMLCYLAGITERIRLGTNIYLLGLRHPFVAARAVQTLDIVSSGRAEIGIGAGWLRQEWQAAGLDPATRGRRLDEALAICKRLWSEESLAHEGEFFRFERVHFDPKPIQKPYPPIHVGGESEAALKRAARDGDGWLGVHHTLASVQPQIRRIHELRNEFGREGEDFEVTVGASPESLDEIQALEEAGVARLIVRPWRRTSEAMDGIRHFAERFLPRP